MPKISIVITTFNSKDFISSCLDSIFSQDYQDFEVSVVDNGSRDGTPDYVKKRYPRVILVENKQNLGACRARNQGIELSRGEWVLTLDCDVTLEEGFVLKIIKTIENLLPKVGMLQPKILRPGGGTIYSCGIYLSWLRRFFDLGKGKKDRGQFDKRKYIFGSCSACACYNRKMLQEIKEDSGYFDEKFFFLVEDVDLAWRAQNRNWRALFIPEANCYHTGKSSHTSRKLRQCLCFRNRYYSIMKNEGIKDYSKKLFPLLFYDLPRLFYLAFTNREAIKATFNRLSRNSLF